MNLAEMTFKKMSRAWKWVLNLISEMVFGSELDSSWISFLGTHRLAEFT